MSKKVLVLGGTGNISISIVSLLIKSGYETVVFNRGLTNAPLPDGIRVIHGDRYVTDAFEATMLKEKFDVVIDMICQTAEDALSALRAFPDVEQYIVCSTCAVLGTQFDYFPVDETHPLRPTSSYGKGNAEAEAVFMAEYYKNGYPVTIIRPSVTYGRQHALLRQVAWESSWIDRIRKGKPIVVVGEGMMLCQFLHVDDAARGFVGAIGKERCLGQIYHLVKNESITWRDFHHTAMRVLGREVELISSPIRLLEKSNIPGFDANSACQHSFHSGAKIARDIPEFSPSVSLEEGLKMTFDYMETNGFISNSDELAWEDDVIKAVLSL